MYYYAIEIFTMTKKIIFGFLGLMLVFGVFGVVSQNTKTAEALIIPPSTDCPLDCIERDPYTNECIEWHPRTTCFNADGSTFSIPAN